MKSLSRLLLAAVAAALLTSCAHHPPLTPTIVMDPTTAQQPRDTAPVTFTHQPTPTTAAWPTEGATQSRTSATRPAPPATSSTIASTSARPGTSNGEPEQNVIDDPGYSLTTINRKAPAQVAWAYVTLRMSYSYKDSGPAYHSQQAATFAIPASPAATHAPAPGSSAAQADIVGWEKVITDKMQAVVSITEMDVPPSSPATAATYAQTLIHVTWLRTLSSELNAPVRSTGATTVTLQRQRNGTWLVSDSGFSAPN